MEHINSLLYLRGRGNSHGFFQVIIRFRCSSNDSSRYKPRLLLIVTSVRLLLVGKTRFDYTDGFLYRRPIIYFPRVRSKSLNI